MVVLSLRAAWQCATPKSKTRSKEIILDACSNLDAFSNVDFFVIVQCVNGAVWSFRGTAEHPERRDSYKKLVLGFLILGNIPWLIVGIGSLSGRLSSLDELIYPVRSNLFVLDFHISTIILIALSSCWIYFGKSAQTLIDHPGLLNRPVTEPIHMKLFWTACLAGSILGEVFMWVPK